MTHPPLLKLSLCPDAHHRIPLAQDEWVFVLTFEAQVTLRVSELTLSIPPAHLLGPLPSPGDIFGPEDATCLILRFPRGLKDPSTHPQGLFPLGQRSDPKGLERALKALGLGTTLTHRHLSPGGSLSGVPELGAMTCICVEGQGELMEGGQTLPLGPGTVHSSPQGTYQEIHARGELTLLTLFEGSSAFLFPTLRCGARSVGCSISQALGQGILRIDSAGTILSYTPEGGECLRLGPDDRASNIIGLLKDDGQRWLQDRLSQGPETLPAQGVLTLPGGVNAQAVLFPYGSGERSPEFLLALNPTPRAIKSPAPTSDLAIFKHLGLEPGLRTLAPHHGWVILWGEGGSRRTTLGELIHQASPWARGPLRTLHLGTLSPSQLERVLLRGLPGYLDRCLGANTEGTLLLEGFEDHTPSERVEIFKVLSKVGETPKAARCRVICVMKEQPHQGLPPTQSASGMKQRGPFTLLRIPSLREHPGAIPAILHYFLGRHQSGRGLSFTGPALEHLRTHGWRDNLDGLERLALSLSMQFFEGPVGLDAVKNALGDTDFDPTPEGRFLTLFEAEGLHIKAALESTGGNKAQAAKLLGLTRTRLYRKIAEHQLEMHG